jgi:hypothetical protein
MRAQAFAWVTWIDMSTSTRTARLFLTAGAIATAAALSGCYVVPLQPQPTVVHVAPPALAAPPAPITFTARLYPANDAATVYGTVMASVTNDLNGRGYFTTNINGEMFSGEATRIGNAAHEGQANGAGNRGSYISCRYTMSSPTLGTGNCRLNNGAAFSMHVGG